MPYSSQPNKEMICQLISFYSKMVLVEEKNLTRAYPIRKFSFYMHIGDMNLSHHCEFLCLIRCFIYVKYYIYYQSIHAVGEDVKFDLKNSRNQTKKKEKEIMLSIVCITKHHFWGKTETLPGKIKKCKKGYKIYITLSRSWGGWSHDHNYIK